MIGIFAAAWQGHTDRSRSDAQAIRQTIDALGWKHADVAAQLGIAEKQFSRQLAGIEPLNHGRLQELPDTFQREYDKRRAVLRGDLLIERDMVSFIRGAMAFGQDQLARMFPTLAERREA